MRNLLEVTIQVVITAGIVWAAAVALNHSGLFITQHQAYNSIATTK